MSDLTPHLNDEQFTECLLGLDETSPAAAHLAQCAQCREELVRFESSVSDLSVASMAWSEAQPSVSLRARTQKQSRTPLFASATWALAAGCVLAVGIPALRHHERPAGKAIVAESGQATDDSPTEIAQDNKLMKDVSLELGESEPSPLREYGIAAAAGSRRAAQTAMATQTTLRAQ